MPQQSRTGQRPDPHDLAAIHGLLRERFGAPELRRFCLKSPRFHFLLDHFGPGFSKLDMIDAVLVECEDRDLLPALLAEVEAYEAVLSEALAVPRQAPPLPAHFVPRTEVSDALRTHLLAGKTAARGTLVISAVHGLGGIGKTTIVAKLAHEPDLQARFSGGILWATLGQEPDILSCLHEWIQALGVHDFHPTTVDGAAAHLRTLLHDRACLLIVDDAWQASHIRPFLVGGQHCQMLVTTRDATLARKVGARLYDLDVMTEEQALLLFEARLGSLDVDRAEAADLASELGYLPLALELAAAQVEQGFSWHELLAAFRDGLAGLDALDLEEAEYRNESMRLSFRLSLDRLSEEDLNAFGWLGVLPEDARLNPVMATILWDQPQADARKRLLRLRNKALLRPAGDDRYTVHDLLHDEARLRLGEQMPLPQAHAALLARYRVRCRDDAAGRPQWHKLPDDGYLHGNLTWHMENAGWASEIHALLAEQTSEGRNGWHEALEALGWTAGYLADVNRAWRLVEHRLDTPEPGNRGVPADWSRDVGRQCRYGLVVASLNSLAAAIPAELVAALVQYGIWSPGQGLAYASQKPDPEARADALAILAPQLPVETAKAVLREILSTRLLGVFTWDETRPLGFVLTPSTFERITDLMARMRDTSGLQRAFGVALAFQGKAGVIALGSVARAWLKVGKEKKAYEASRNAWRLLQDLDSGWEYARAVTWFVPYLPPSEFDQVLKAARAKAERIGNPRDRAQALATLAALQPGLESERVLHETDQTGPVPTGVPSSPQTSLQSKLRAELAAARSLDDAKARAEALASLVPYLPGGMEEEAVRETVATAKEIRSWNEQVATLRSLSFIPLGELAKNALQEVLGSAFTWPFDDVAARSPEMNLLSPLPVDLEEQQDQPDEFVQTIPDPAAAEYLDLENTPPPVPDVPDGWESADAMIEKLPLLPADEAKRVLRQVVSVAIAAEEKALLWFPRRGTSPADYATTRIALRLAELGYYQEALEVTQAIRRELPRVGALAELSPHLPPELEEVVLHEALEQLASETWWLGDRVQALEWLAPHLVSLSPVKLYPVWQELLPALAAHRTRKELLADLGALAPLIAVLGGEEATAETFRAIQDVGRWWP